LSFEVVTVLTRWLSNKPTCDESVHWTDSSQTGRFVDESICRNVWWKTRIHSRCHL